jgi:hypothetical protein
VGRGRSCFSCGETQAGSGQFCRACGKPLDAPDLELLSGEVNTHDGTDVVMSVGGSKGRSAVAIVAVLATLGGVAAFSGKAAPSTTASTTTTPTSVQRRPTTTTTAPPETSTTSTTDAAAARAREIALTQPRTLVTPILPEKTGLKLLVIGIQQIGSGQRDDAIIDLDSGLLTPFPGSGSGSDSGSGFGAPVSIQPYGVGLVVSDAANYVHRFDIWQPDGTKQSVRLPSSGLGVYYQREVLAGDVMWSYVSTSTEDSIPLAKLVGHDLRDGHQVAEIALPETAQLAGVDDQGQPVVLNYGSGTYILDPATVTFKRITTNLLIAVQGEVRIEYVCDEQLLCGAVLLRGNQAPKPLPDIVFSGGQISSMSPNGEIALRVTYGNGGSPGVEAIDLGTGARQKIDMSADTFPLTFSWSPDSKWLFGIANGSVKAWKVGTPDTLTLSLDGDPLRATAIGVFPTG